MYNFECEFEVTEENSLLKKSVIINFLEHTDDLLIVIRNMLRPYRTKFIYETIKEKLNSNKPFNYKLICVKKVSH